MKLLMLIFVAAGSICGMAMIDGLDDSENVRTLVLFLSVATLVWITMIALSKKTKNELRFAYFVPPATVLLTAIVTFTYLKYFAP